MSTIRRTIEKFNRSQISLIAASGFMANLTMAAGEGHGGGSPIDLWAAIINFLAFGFVMVYLIYPLMKEHFAKLHKETKEHIESSKNRAFEIENKLETQKNKMNGLSREIDSLKSQTEKEIADYKQKLNQETENRIQRLTDEAQRKIEFTKQQFNKKLEAEVTHLIVDKARTKINADSELRTKIGDGLVKELSQNV